jgi:hypothetical protein
MQVQERIIQTDHLGQPLSEILGVSVSSEVSQAGLGWNGCAARSPASR